MPVELLTNFFGWPTCFLIAENDGMETALCTFVCFLETAGLVHVGVHGHRFFHRGESHLFVHVALDH